MHRHSQGHSSTASDLHSQCLFVRFHCGLDLTSSDSSSPLASVHCLDWFQVSQEKVSIWDRKGNVGLSSQLPHPEKSGCNSWQVTVHCFICFIALSWMQWRWGIISSANKESSCIEGDPRDPFCSFVWMWFLKGLTSVLYILLCSISKELSDHLTLIHL